MDAETKRIELLRRMRGYINPGSFMATLCIVSGIKWEQVHSTEEDHALEGLVDGRRILITRKEWLPLNAEQGMDLVAQKLKEALQ